MGWLISGSILLLLAMLPLGVRVKYDGDGLQVKAVLGPATFSLYPRPKKEPKEKTAPSEVDKNGEESLPKPPKPPKPGKEKKPVEGKKGGSLTDFLPLVKTALAFLGDFRRKLRVDDLYLRLILAGGDPCDLAINYGRAWAAVGNLMPQLERLLVIKKRDIEVECDFTASQTLVIARIELTITLGRTLALVVVYGIRALKEYLKIKKGGAEK